MLRISSWNWIMPDHNHVQVPRPFGEIFYLTRAGNFFNFSVSSSDKINLTVNFHRHQHISKFTVLCLYSLNEACRRHRGAAPQRLTLNAIVVSSISTLRVIYFNFLPLVARQSTWSDTQYVLSRILDGK